MTVTITDNCSKRLLALRDQEKKPSLMLRVQVNGGGCQGFEYHFEMTDSSDEDDQVFEKDGVQIIVDSISLPYLEGAEIDYVDDLIGAHFHINNPNAQSSCGCGTSFSV